MSEYPKPPVWPEMKDELKIKSMIRLIKALTGAKGIKCYAYPMGDGRIILEDVDVDDVGFVNAYGTNEYGGMVLEFEAEPCVVEPPSDEFLPMNDAKINAEIWFWEDPWATIEDLRDKIQSLKGSTNNE